MKYLRQYLAAPLTVRLLALAGLALVVQGYSMAWMPESLLNGDITQLTQHVVTGILMVVAGSGLIGAVVFWRQ